MHGLNRRLLQPSQGSQPRSRARRTLNRLCAGAAHACATKPYPACPRSFRRLKAAQGVMKTQPAGLARARPGKAPSESHAASAKAAKQQCTLAPPARQKTRRHRTARRAALCLGSNRARCLPLFGVKQGALPAPLLGVKQGLPLCLPAAMHSQLTVARARRRPAGGPPVTSLASCWPL